MSGRVPDDTLQSIRDRTSIVELVSAYVSLRKAGRNHLGLCPFHAEKTPSFTVNEERGLFHCFGCGAGGTVFTFLMKANHVDFREAVELLAKRAGINLPQTEAQGSSGRLRQELIKINEAAQQYFTGMLNSPRGSAAREYLKTRGLSEKTILTYGLGLCPDGPGLVRSLSAQGLPLGRAAELGLVGRRSDGSAYDRFWDRITFPIRDNGGRIVGFGGRTLGSNHPKYLNSPESLLFHKGEVLYGLFEGRQAIRQAERVVIVEGYMDVLALVESGIDFAVASLGTALGAVQLRLAKRFASEVIAFFDGDRAGQNAAAKAFSVCAEADVWGLGAFLPEGFDPDTFVRTHGKAATLALLQHALPLADFFVQFNTPDSKASVPERARAAEKIGEVLSSVHDPAMFGLLARKASQQIGVDEEVFRAKRNRNTAPRGKARESVVATPDSAPAFRPEELQLVEAMSREKKVVDLVHERDLLKEFESELLADAGARIAAAWSSGQGIGAIVDQLPAAIAQRITAGLVGEGAEVNTDQLQIAEQCISRIDKRRRNAQAHVFREQIQRAEACGDRSGSIEVLRRANELRTRRSSQCD